MSKSCEMSPSLFDWAIFVATAAVAVLLLLFVMSSVAVGIFVVSRLLFSMLF